MPDTTCPNCQATYDGEYCRACCYPHDDDCDCRDCTEMREATHGDAMYDLEGDR